MYRYMYKYYMTVLLHTCTVLLVVTLYWYLLVVVCCLQQMSTSFQMTKSRRTLS